MATILGFASTLKNSSAPHYILRHTRFFVQAAGPASGSTSTPATSIQHRYFVPRNSRGSLPVYTDVRNGGSRYLVLIRGVDGDANLLAKDLANTLFEPRSDEAARMNIEIIRSRNLVISGGRWKNQVVEWLKGKGF